MPINFLDLNPQIQTLAENAVLKQSDLKNKLEACTELLNQHANDLSLLQKAVEEAAAQNKMLRCAVPVKEPLTTHFAVKLPAPSCTLISADGSQINPDPHGALLYGLVNVGVFVMHPGSGKAPKVFTHSDLLEENQLHTSTVLTSEDLIALLRDTKERQILANYSAKQPTPVVTLTDGPLELHHEPHQDQAFAPYFEKYLAALDDLALNEVITAGYVDRPRADSVVKMLELLLPQPATPERPFAGLTDLALFEKLLSPGERSAVFGSNLSTRINTMAAKRYTFFISILEAWVNPPLRV